MSRVRKMENQPTNAVGLDSFVAFALAIVNTTIVATKDLSNNNLTGAVPEFLSQLQSLTLLNLQGNKLNGTVPVDLVERSKNGLLLSVEGNLNLCASLSCKTTKKKKKTVVVPIAASLASFAVLIIALATLWRLKRKPPVGPNIDDEYQKSAASLESRNRQLKFSEVQRMTNSFERILGKGGFGTVFHGFLDGTQVAVKMLSHSSVQTKVSLWLCRYYTSNRLTEKSDVYGFGIVLLEVIMSRPVISETNNERTHISQWVSSMLSRGDIQNIVDIRLRGDFDVNSVWKAVEVAMTCLSPTSTRRPTMNQVVLELTHCLSAERARTVKGHGNESQDSIGMISVNFGTELSPLPR